jgi:hypothetical protein
MPTLKTKQIASLKEYISSVESFRGNRRGPLWYRGCGKTTHVLAPSLYRHKSSKSIEDLMSLEKKLLARFRERSIPFLSRHMANSWEWLFLMQHYGVPTRLLDWSESPLMALFFAVTSARHALGFRGNPVFNGDAAVWLLDVGGGQHGMQSWRLTMDRVFWLLGWSQSSAGSDGVARGLDFLCFNKRTGGCKLTARCRIKSLRATRDGRSSSAFAGDVMSTACLS